MILLLLSLFIVTIIIIVCSVLVSWLNIKDANRMMLELTSASVSSGFLIKESIYT